ncbi:MAG: DsbA family protein [Colwellia sp.]|nr:DsbA family protein [Colwellia sp.]
MTTPSLPKESSTQLFFIYDSHCPWSYVVTPLVNEINKAFPDMPLHLWHAAFFDGKSDDSTAIKIKEIQAVEKLAGIHFSEHYHDTLKHQKNSILSANLMTWAQHKTPSLALPLLNALQGAHFGQGNQLTLKADLDNIINELKLSPPAKVLNSDKLSKDALSQLEEIFALQEIINTEAIPALLLAVDEQLILLNHNFYLTEPKAIVEAVRIELDKYNQ